jgi:multiple sugar transport system permease protein
MKRTGMSELTLTSIKNRPRYNYRRPIFWFLVPIAVFMGLFFLFPVLYEVYISFFDFSLGRPMTFIGLGNYRTLIFDDQFIGSLRTTALFVVLAVGIQISFGLAIALLFHMESRIMSVIRTLIMIPTVFTPLVAGLVWKSLYHPDLGAVTYYLRELGINIGRGLLVERHLALGAIIVIDVWQWTPLMVIIILAGLKSIPTEPYEVGVIDGANRLQLFWYVTVPLLRPTLTVALLIRTLDALKIFDIIWATTNGGPGTVTTVANLRIYEVGIQQLRVGYAAALSNVLLLTGIILGIIFIRSLYSDKQGVSA